MLGLSIDLGAYRMPILARLRAAIEPVVAFWPFTVTSGSTVYDVGPSSLHLTPRRGSSNVDIGTFDAPPTRVGATVAIHVNGTNEWLRGSDHASLVPGPGGFSVGAFIKNTSVHSNVIIAKNTDVLPNPQEWVFWERDTDGLLQYWLFDSVNGGSIKTTANAVLDTAWHSVIGTYDGGTSASGIDLYVDGALIASTDTETGTFQSVVRHTTPVSVAAIHDVGDTGQDLFAGSLALPFVSGTRLSAASVAAFDSFGRALLGSAT